MRVKRLEIQGFKSFKDKTVIHFDHGITGIVGPNGCGKSNIVDAFFWVMGEQSYKHMRGSGSDDLIFNGSSKYSPLGMAEATMVLEAIAVDTENAAAGASTQDIAPQLKTKEIAVTRRLYRGGEGEYFINGVPARLKDIHELFMDTGVGAKGYSVIEQGQIGKIVNAKPEDRRQLVEEAAGIAKYKARKKESLRKLEAAQGNLSRLTDVIQEIERSLGSLERQAQKARQYKKYKEELLDKEMTWGRRKTLVIRQRLEQLKKDREALEQELAGLKAELHTAETTVEADRIEQITDTKQAEDLQSRIQDLSDELARERSALDLSRRRQTDLSNQLQSLEAEKQELELSLTDERARLASRESESNEADLVFKQAAERAQQMDEDVRALRQDATHQRRQLEANKKELMDGIETSSNLMSRTAAIESRIESTRAQAERLAAQIGEQNAKLEAARAEAATAVTSAESLKTKRAELHEEKKMQAARLQEQEEDLRSSERALDESNRALTKLRSRFQSLEELAEAREGFGEGPKAALEWAKSSGKAAELRALADVLEVEGGYEVALEGWLENHLEDLVSSDAGVVLDAFESLRSEKKGRAAVHVGGGAGSAGAVELASLRPALEAAGFEVLGDISDFVKVSAGAGEADAEAARRALNGACIVRSLEPARAFLADGGLARLGGWSLVALDGSALDSRGVLRGGSTQATGEAGNAASLLGRKRVMSELQAEISHAETAQAELESAVLRTRQNLELARARYQTLQADVQSLDIQIAAMDRDVHQANRTLRELEGQLQGVQREKERADRELEQCTAERASIEEKVSSLIGRRQELEALISSTEADVSAREGEVHAQESELQALRINEASLRERASSLKRECESVRSWIGDRERRLAEVNRVLERATNEREQFTGGDAELEQKIEDLTRSLSLYREQLAIVKDKMEQASAKVNAALERIKELHKIGDQRTSDSTQFALEAEKMSGELQHLIQNLEEKYGLGCLDRPVTSPVQEEMSAPIVTTEMSAEEEQLLGEEVERLRERIRRLGEVNVMAIEEHAELSKRYEYLMAEKGDLEQSIKNLEEAIEHINKTSEERFAKAFEAIATRFERLFPIIFGGGQAKLSLVYPEGSTDILEAGVDILAQPPGKKVTNIGLLSGGEKALTAVSLIFAIFMVKPSPFCVLDEVDAPLDDANIGKFNALLREMSVKSQFILITHNKKTMELNDTLYGVTMEEPGVSKMVSIQMQ